MKKRRDYQWVGPTKPMPDIETPPLKVGIIPTPDFTMLSFSCLVEYLRLAADESDFSRKVYCAWDVLSLDEKPIRSSNGLAISPTGSIDDLAKYDVLVFHGGILHSRENMPAYIYDAIGAAVELNVPLVGLCTGQFLFAEMGLLNKRQCAVHFSLEPALRRHFPEVIPIFDKPVVSDGRYITCPGGLASINLGTYLVSRYCGTARAEKVLHYLMADKTSIFGAVDEQHQGFVGERCPDRRVVNAIGIMRQQMYERCDISDIAKQVGTTKRGLTRLFNQHLRVPPATYWRGIRLSSAHWMIVNTDRSVAQIAYECGFTDSSHMIRWFLKRYKLTPTALRRRNSSSSLH